MEQAPNSSGENKTSLARLIRISDLWCTTFDFIPPIILIFAMHYFVYKAMYSFHRCPSYIDIFFRTRFKADDHTAQWHDYIYRCLLLAMLDGSHPWLLSVCLTVTPMCHGGTWWIFASIIIPFISSLSGASVCLIRVKLLVTLPYTGQILFLHLFKHLIYSLPESLISTKTNKSACTTKAGILN